MTPMPGTEVHVTLGVDTHEDSTSRSRSTSSTASRHQRLGPLAIGRCVGQEHVPVPTAVHGGHAMSAGDPGIGGRRQPESRVGQAGMC